MIIDSHTHIFPGWLRDQRQRYIERDVTFFELYADPKTKMATAEDLIQVMDEDGVDLSVVMGIGWTDHGLASEVNDYIIDSVSRYSDRIVGLAGVNPTWGEAAAKEADRCARAGLKGVGELHPDTQQYDLGDTATMAPMLSAVTEHNLPVWIHSSEPVGHVYQGIGAARPDMLWRLIQEIQDVTFVCSHWGGGLPFYALVPEVAVGLDNIYYDTAASPLLYEAKVFAVVADLVGADHILMGSGFPFVRVRRLLEQVAKSPLSEEQKEAVNGANAARLLGIGGHGKP